MSGSFAHVLNWHSRPACVDVMDANTWTLARDVVAGAGEVSTVWNPVAFNTWRIGTPKHFETLVFLPEGGCGDSCTYVTEEEARDGHARMVSALRSLAETLAPPTYWRWCDACRDMTSHSNAESCTKCAEAQR